LAQKQQELNEAAPSVNRRPKAYELTSKELSVTKPLIGSGAVSEVELLRLERDVSRFRGERDMAGADRPLAGGHQPRRRARSGSRARLPQRGAQGTRRDPGQAQRLAEGSVGLADKVKHSEMRSPVRGTVKRLLVNTVGGVVQPGKDVVEMVPLEDNLLLEAKVHPKDIAFLRPGRRPSSSSPPTTSRSTAGSTPSWKPSAPTPSPTSAATPIYTVKVRTAKSSLGENLPIIPGMVAEVDIVTGQKSILAYLLKPVLKAKQAAFTER
jgi:adhesin transport system membrane fusion protein